MPFFFFTMSIGRRERKEKINNTKKPREIDSVGYLCSGTPGRTVRFDSEKRSVQRKETGNDRTFAVVGETYD